MEPIASADCSSYPGNVGLARQFESVYTALASMNHPRRAPPSRVWLQPCYLSHPAPEPPEAGRMALASPRGTCPMPQAESSRASTCSLQAGWKATLMACCASLPFRLGIGHTYGGNHRYMTLVNGRMIPRRTAPRRHVSRSPITSELSVELAPPDGRPPPEQAADRAAPHFSLTWELRLERSR